MIPVIAPIGVGKKGETFNINADSAAGAIASALSAAKLIMLTDVAGVLDRDKKLVQVLTPRDVLVLRGQGVITGGMIPKIETCWTPSAMASDQQPFWMAASPTWCCWKPSPSMASAQ